MKVKARDIVAGWPKPRSTSTFIPTLEDFAFCDRIWLNRKGAVPYLVELEATVRYHEDQKRMLHEYFETFRMADPWSVAERLSNSGFWPLIRT